MKKKEIKYRLREMTEKQEETYNEAAHNVLEGELTKRAEKQEACADCGKLESEHFIGLLGNARTGKREYCYQDASIGKKFTPKKKAIVLNDAERYYKSKEKSKNQICTDPECGHERVFHSNYPPKKYLKDGECTKCHFEKVDNPCKKFTPKNHSPPCEKCGKPKSEHKSGWGKQKEYCSFYPNIHYSPQKNAIGSVKGEIPTAEGTQNQESHTGQNPLAHEPSKTTLFQNQEKGCGKIREIQDRLDALLNENDSKEYFRQGHSFIREIEDIISSLEELYPTCQEKEK